MLQNFRIKRTFCEWEGPYSWIISLSVSAGNRRSFFPKCISKTGWQCVTSHMLAWWYTLFHGTYCTQYVIIPYSRRTVATFSVINRISQEFPSAHNELYCAPCEYKSPTFSFNWMEQRSFVCIQDFLARGRVFRRSLTTSVDIAGRARHPVITCCCCCYSLQKRALLCQLPFGS